ncbi:MAG: acyl-CoA dehydrogenase family protein [Hyphomicrobiales bacterium]|nr:acyl-CoA dehydrogenase family protein [Hyphomicrobiales bacterium]
MTQAGAAALPAQAAAIRALGLSDETLRLLAAVDEMGPAFAERAFRYDADASFPSENYDDLRAAGFLKLCVPKHHGGLGADYPAYMLVSQRLGFWCGTTANTFNMHVANALWTADLVDTLDLSRQQRAEHEARRALHYGRMVGGALYAQPFSEASSAAAGVSPFGTTAKRVDGGFVLDGRKIFASLSGAADFYGVLCTELKARTRTSRRDTMFVAVPASAKGLSIVGDWDPLGMRGTVSRTLILKNVFVPDDEQLMPRGIYMQAAMRWPHMFMTLTATYLGVLQAAYEFTLRYLRGEIPGIAMKRRMYPTKQIAVAEMLVKLELAWAIFLRAIAEAKRDPSEEERARALACQFTVMEHCNDICRLAIRTCGGQSMLKSLPLERYYRDSRCGSLMLPWTAEICMDRLGRAALYRPGETDE